MSEIAAIILAGGESRRMGRSKADLMLSGETFLQRAVRLLSAVASPVIVSAAPEQIVPDFAGKVVIARDPRSGSGPLQGFTTGLRAMPRTTELAYLSAVDAPFFTRAWLELLAARIGDQDAVVGVIDDRPNPVAALYRCSPVSAAAEELLSSGTRRLSAILSIVQCKFLAEEELRQVDPDLATALNINTTDEYEQAQARLKRSPVNPRNDG